MARRPLRFRQTDLVRAMRATHNFARDAGLPESAVQARIEPDGAITVWIAEQLQAAGLPAPARATVAEGDEAPVKIAEVA